MSRLPDLSRFKKQYRDKESWAEARAVASLSAKALLNNWAVLRQEAKVELLPMVKADGYGHGAAWVARTLLREPGLYGFGVATLAEGAALREELGPRARRTPVVIFSDTSPWSDDVGAFCESEGLTPVIGTDESWNAFLKGGWPGKLKYHLEFDTGMNRIGIDAALGARVAKEVSRLAVEARPEGVLTHLASGDDPESRLTQKQLESFRQLRGLFDSVSPGTRFHFGASSAIWNAQRFRMSELSDFARPGISLYGAQPWFSAPTRGLLPVMTVYSRVLRRFRVREGDTIGYGGSYKVVGGKREVAVLGFGYADGFSRLLSNRGRVFVGGHEEEVLGRVSMDLIAVGCSPGVAVGDWATVLGGAIGAWEQARRIDTIPYELFTSVSQRVPRKEEENA